MRSHRHLNAAGCSRPMGAGWPIKATRTTANDVFVVPWPDRSPRQQVSLEGGVRPTWSPDGSTLYYWRPEEGRYRLISVSVAPGERFTTTATVELFDVDASTDRGIAVLPGEQEFLLVVDNPEAIPRELHVVVNWFEELRQRMGGN